MSNFISKLAKKLTKEYIQLYVGISQKQKGEAFTNEQFAQLTELAKRACIEIVNPIKLKNIKPSEFVMQTYAQCEITGRTHVKDIFYNDVVLYNNIVIGLKNSAKCTCKVPDQPPIDQRQCEMCASGENLLGGIYVEKMEMPEGCTEEKDAISTGIFDWIYICEPCNGKLVAEQATEQSIIEETEMVN